MPYKILEHTADLRIKVAGNDIPHLFSEAMLAMMEVLQPIAFKKESDKPSPWPQGPGKLINHRIIVDSVDKTALLIDFLNEALSKSQINKEAYTEVKIIEITDTRLISEISGKRVEGFKKDVKAATHHEALIKENKNGQLETILVFDI
jgi:SHS2 domain-containing protein